MANEILLRSAAPPNVNEKLAQSTITPGELVEIAATGYIKPHATATGAAAAWFALAAGWNLGSTSSSSSAVDATYAAESTVPFVEARQGDHIWAWLEPSHAAVAEGALLESGGSGNLQAGTTSPIARAAEAHDGTSSTRARIKVVVI